MLIKEARLCCAFSWSPAAAASGPMIATGSVAGAMDDDFNSEAFLEIRKVDVTDTNSREMPLVGRTPMADRVFRIDWSPFGGDNGIIAGCFTDGSVQVWSVDVILRNFLNLNGEEQQDPVLCRIAAHTGVCRTLQFSPTQPHYLATGGQDKELCIWSLQDPKEPAAVPALTKATHPSEITDVKWNPKFAHIIATATSAGIVTVWDLKARRTALTFNVSANQPGAANAIAWHPDISTCIAVARDDVNPVIQIWDLKKAVAPARELRGHTKGVTAMSWNAEDPSLLLSCGCDGRTLCWNPTTGDILGELPSQDNWIYEVQWCPGVTAVVATSSFDSSLGVFSAQDLICGAPGTRTVPKWLRRPCGAVFGFGGRIATPVKGRPSTICVTTTTRGDASADLQFRQSLAAHPPHTPERINLLNQLGFPLVAATEACALQGGREPLLQFLGVSPAEIEGAVDQLEQPYSKEEDEFEELLSKCIVAGRPAAGVRLCLAASRLDDAFAVAQLTGPLTKDSIVADVLRSYVGSGKLRFVKYLNAAALGALETLVDDASLPWKEVLALLATYVGNPRFAPLADAFASSLKQRGEMEGAAAAFLSAGNVNAVADLYSETGLSAQKLVQLITLIEHTTSQQCTSTSFAQSLSSYAGALAAAGDFEGALLLSNRAAQLGDVAAAIVADRIQYHVPSAAAVRVGFPFTLALLPDAATIECQLMASRQQPLQAPVAAVVAPQGYQPAAQQQSQRAAQPLAHGASAPYQQPQSAVASTQPQYATPGATAQAQYSAAPAPAQPQYAPVAPAQPHNVAPQPAPQHLPQVPQPQYSAPVQPQPQLAHTQMPTYTQPPTAPAPASHPHPAPPQPPLVSAPPQQATIPVQSIAAIPPQQPLRPQTHADPSPNATVQPAAAALPQAAVASYDVSKLPVDLHQQIARGIIDATAKVTDKRKRDAIEKSALELFDRLSQNKVPSEVVNALLGYVQSIGTPAAKENWRKISDAHMHVVQPFLNIKFL